MSFPLTTEWFCQVKTRRILLKKKIQKWVFFLINKNSLLSSIQNWRQFSCYHVTKHRVSWLLIVRWVKWTTNHLATYLSFLVVSKFMFLCCCCCFCRGRYEEMFLGFLVINKIVHYLHGDAFQSEIFKPDFHFALDKFWDRVYWIFHIQKHEYK